MRWHAAELPLQRCVDLRTSAHRQSARQFAFAFVLAFAATSCAFAADELQAGIAVVDITPPIPFRMSGYFYGAAQHRHERPAARQGRSSFSKATRSAALVFCDLVGVPLRRRRRGPRRRPAKPPASRPSTSPSPPRIRTRGRCTSALCATTFTSAASSKLGKDPYDSDRLSAPSWSNKIVAASSKRKATLQPVELKSRLRRRGSPLVQPPLSHEGRLGAVQSGRAEPGHRSPGRADRSAGRHHLAHASRARASRPRAIVSFAMHLDTVERHRILGRLSEVRRGRASRRRSAPISRCCSAPARAATSITST